MQLNNSEYGSAPEYGTSLDDEITGGHRVQFKLLVSRLVVLSPCN